ncbi:hypothetical protein FGO68_gene15098 [Halteria grandinella]|uniref:RING-type domain-containing protein n=1 Tax=Halteria grandinella TaxID=5974 RepID=A0A8J8NC57_HALGN|nr:hypothetical protein FGO68_gene15098 [Halteria grandinella]
MQIIQPQNVGNQLSNILGNLNRRAFGKNKIQAAKNDGMAECVICMEEYKETDEIAELKCDQRHYFHSKCLEQWLKRKLECPLCKRQVDLAKK